MIHWLGKVSSKRQRLTRAWNGGHTAVRHSGEIVQVEGTIGAKPQASSRETKETGGTAWECGSRVLIEEEEARAHSGDVEPRKEFGFDSKCDGKPVKPNDGF